MKDTQDSLKTYKNRYDEALAKAKDLLSLGKKLKVSRRKKTGEIISYLVDGVKIRKEKLMLFPTSICRREEWHPNTALSPEDKATLLNPICLPDFMKKNQP